MPEKKPVPPPAPRNRRERRKRATEQRKARPWTRPKPKPELPGEWFTYSPSPGCKPVFEVIRDGMGEMDKPAHTITGSPGHVPGDVVVVPGEDGKPELRPYQKRAMDAALNSGSFIVDSDGCAVGIGGFTRPTSPADPPPASFDHKL